MEAFGGLADGVIFESWRKMMRVEEEEAHKMLGRSMYEV